MLTENDQITYQVGGRKRLPRNQNGARFSHKENSSPKHVNSTITLGLTFIYNNATVKDVRVFIFAVEKQ